MANEVSKLGGVATNVPAAALENALKHEEKINIREGMRTADVEANGTEAQKLVAKAFEDITHPGTYDKMGADAMNNYSFGLKDNSLRAYNKDTKCCVTIEANSQEELKEYAELVRNSELYENGNITYDLKSKTTTYDGVSARRDFPFGKKQTAVVGDGLRDVETINIKNCSFRKLDATKFTGNLNIVNTKDFGLIWDSALSLDVHKNPEKRPVINIDKESKVEIE